MQVAGPCLGIIRLGTKNQDYLHEGSTGHLAPVPHVGLGKMKNKSHDISPNLSVPIQVHMA